MGKADLLNWDVLLHSDGVQRLFQVLDDQALFIYNLWKEGKSEYPSEDSILVLIEGVRTGLGKSKALEAMDKNLAKDLLKM